MIVGALAGVAAAVSQPQLPLPCAFGSALAAEAADRLLITCKDAAEFYIISSTNGRTVEHRTLAAPGGASTNNVAFSPDGREAAVSWRDGTISMWRDGDSRVHSWKAPFYANSLAFSRNGQSLYVDGTEVSTDSGLPTGRSLRGDFDAPNAIAFDAAGRKAIVAEADTTLRLYDTRSGKVLRTVDFDVEPLVADIDPQTGDIIAGLADGTIAQFGPSLNLIRKYAGVNGTMPVLIMSRGTHLLAALAPQVGGAQPTPQLLDYRTGKWTTVPSAQGAVAAQRKGKSVIVYMLRGTALLAEELEIPAK